MLISLKLDAMITRFWWAVSSSSGIHWVKQSILHLPKGMGRLAICSISLVNKGFLMKKAQSLFANHNSLLSKTFTSISPSPILSGVSHSKCRTSSWASRSLMHAEELLLKVCSWKIGNGYRVKTFGVPQFYNSTPKAYYSLTLRQAQISKVNNLICSSPNPHQNTPMLDKSTVMKMLLPFFLWTFLCVTPRTYWFGLIIVQVHSQ